MSESNRFIGLNQEPLTDNEKIADAFSEHFQTIFSPKSLPKYNESHISEQTINEVILSMTDILREIENLDEKKSFGFSKIQTNIIKLCKDSFTKIYFKLFSAIVKFKKIPVSMKKACVTPIHKKGKPKENISSYRGISVSKNDMQVFKSLILNQLNAFIVKNKFLPEVQYGFRTGLNNSILLTDLIHDLTLSFNDYQDPLKLMLCI
jgi:hypothetical protein